MIKIFQPYIKNVEDNSYLISRIIDERQGIDKEIFYKVENIYGQYLTNDVCDAFVVGCLLPAAKYNEDIVVEGAISERLSYNITNSILYILSFIYGNKVQLKVKEVINPCYNSKGVGCGCSLGVDSFAAMLQHLPTPPHIKANKAIEVPDAYKITHLTYFNVGAMGYVNLDKAKLSYEKDIQMVYSFAKEVNLPVVKLESNFSLLYNDFDFDASGDLRNFSAALSLQKLFGKYLYGSTFPMIDFKFDKGQTGYYESLLAPLISTNNTEIIIANPDMTRIDKTKYIINDYLAQRYLYVCWKELIANKWPNSEIAKIKDKYQNCTRCDKCKRTLLALELLCGIDGFENLFDIAYWNEIKHQYIAKVIYKRDDNAFYKDLYQLIKDKQYPIDASIKKELLKLKFKNSIIVRIIVRIWNKLKV